MAQEHQRGGLGELRQMYHASIYGPRGEVWGWVAWPWDVKSHMSEGPGNTYTYLAAFLAGLIAWTIGAVAHGHRDGRRMLPPCLA